MRRFVAALILAILAMPLLATPALGHERRMVGPYQFVVGWLNEPAFSGQVNGIDLTVTDTTKSNAAVEGLEQTLKAEIFYGGLTAGHAVTLRARFGQPGKYAADVMPTKDGSYTFRIFGKVGATDVNEKFESGPKTFGDVEPLSALQYPQTVPNGAELGDRLAALQTSVDQVRLLSIVAVIVGIVAIGLGAWRRARA
jgi:hypothetical protein